jgi:hypothetical protein
MRIAAIVRPWSDVMKAGKVVLAILLAVGTVAAYWYFPNPLEQAEQKPAQEEAPADADAAKPG